MTGTGVSPRSPGRSFGKLAIAAVVAAVAYLNSCTRLETGRDLVYIPSEGRIVLNRHGRHLSLLTPEGPYPKWREEVQIQLATAIPATGVASVSLPADGTSPHVSHGTIRLDFTAARAEVKLKASDSYDWIRPDGTYPIQIE